MNLIKATLVGVSLTVGCLSQASTVFSNFDSAGAFGSVGFTVSGINSSLVTQIAVAAQFTPSASGTLASITLPLGYAEGTNSFTVQLCSNNAGVPGTVLETWNLTSLPFFWDQTTVTQLADTASVSLSSTSSYWVVCYAADDALAGWNKNSIADVGPVGTQTNGSAFVVGGDTRPTFSVATTAASAALVELGLAR